MSSHKKAQRAEHELLLCCARTNAAAEVVARLRELAAAQLDWEYFFLLARRHAVLPLVYLQLVRHAAELVPQEHLGRLKQNYFENSARNTVLTAELCRLITLFAKSGVEAIAYKGPALAVFAYDNLALRRFVDLDVIVKKTDISQARDILLAEGYTPTKSLSLNQQEILVRTQYNIQFSRDERRLIVELHWEVAPHLFASSINADALWQNPATVELNGAQVKTIAAGDLLFSLCVHGSRHLWERLSWICDVAELLARRSFGWSTLLARAAQSDSERMFLLGLYLAERLLAAPLPNEVKQRCAADNRLKSLAGKIVEHLFDGTAHTPATSQEIFKYNLGVRKSLSSRARYLFHILRPTDSDLAVHSLPSFAYYLMRPVRLLTRTSRVH
jgi:hypothetical protein